MMCSAPRWAVHQALAEKTPATYAARHAPPLELGLSPDMEDAAIAYRLLMEVTAPISVGHSTLTCCCCCVSLSYSAIVSCRECLNAACLFPASADYVEHGIHSCGTFVYGFSPHGFLYCHSFVQTTPTITCLLCLVVKSAAHPKVCGVSAVWGDRGCSRLVPELLRCVSHPHRRRRA